MEDYLIELGRQFKRLRKQKNQTLSEIAQRAEVTSGLVSRIENGRTIPSLPVFFKLIGALETEVAEFFESLPVSSSLPYIVIKNSDHNLIEKEDEARGFHYMRIFGKQLNINGFETVLLELEPNAKRQKISTDAFEFKYVISGACIYLIDEKEIVLEEGDALFFDGRIPHVPKNYSGQVCRMLVIYFYL
jgi:transcriptional regulator with XRE-family HTH domain